MIVQRFLIAYKKNPKLILDLYNEVYGKTKDNLSEDEIRNLHKDTLNFLRNLLNNQDENDTLNKFFLKIKQFKYAGYDIEDKYLALSSAVKHGRKNNEILEKYIDSKDNQKVATIIDYLGRIVDITLDERDKLNSASVYETELKDPASETVKEQVSEATTTSSYNAYKNKRPSNFLSHPLYPCLVGLVAGAIFGKLVGRIILGSIAGCVLVSGIFIITKNKR